MTELAMRKFAHDRKHDIEFKPNQFLDCRLVPKGIGCKDETRMVSSMVLLAASPFLRQILPPPGEDHEDTVILLPDWPLEIVNKAVDYIYKGVIWSTDTTNHNVLGSVSFLLESLGIPMTESNVEIYESENTHSNEKHPVTNDPPTCDVCGESFRMNIQLNIHRKTEHKENELLKNGPLNTNDTAQITPLDNDKPKKLYQHFCDVKWQKCPICNRNNIDPIIFKKQEYFIAHLFSHSAFAEIVSRQEPNEGMYSCEQPRCPMMFSAEDKPRYLKHKYGYCKYDTRPSEQCGTVLRLNDHIVNILHQFTLGHVKFVEEELQQQSRRNTFGDLEFEVRAKVRDDQEYVDNTEEMENTNDQVSIEDASVSTSRRTQSRATSSESNCGDPIKCTHCKRLFHSQKQYGRHECVENPPKEVIEEDPSPDAKKRNSHECKICNGPKNLKPVLKDNESLMNHYLLGHYQNFFKKNKKNDLHINEFPWTCTKCAGKDPEKLNNWEEVILHLGKDHERLYYALQHDPVNEMRNVQKFLFPDRDKKHRAKRAASRTPEKRRSHEKSREKRKRADSPGAPSPLKRSKQQQVKSTNVSTQASSPLVSDNEVEPLIRCERRVVEDGQANPVIKHVRNLNDGGSNGNLVHASKDEELEKPQSDKEPGGLTSWEAEMNRAGTGIGNSGSANDTMKRPGVICHICDEIFATRENLRLHTCESRLDQRDLTEATAGFQKRRTSSSSARTSSSSARTSSSSVDQPSEKLASRMPFRNPTGIIQTSNPLTKQSKKTEIPQASKDQSRISHKVDIILEPVMNSFEVSDDEDEPGGEIMIDSNFVKHSILPNNEDHSQGEREKECHIPNTANAIRRSISTDDGGVEGSNDLKCDNCPLVFPNKNIKKKHMKCRRCQKTCINLKVHKHCPVCEKCYTEGISAHYICDVCEDKCFKKEDERQTHKKGHSWDDYS